MPTEAEIEAARTAKGGWTKAQLAKWGVPWPPPKGWKQRLIALEELAELTHELGFDELDSADNPLVK